MARTKKSRPRTKSDARTKLQGRKKVVLGRDEAEMGFPGIIILRPRDGKNRPRPERSRNGICWDFDTSS